MHTADQLPAPLNTFVVDIPTHTYYDFKLKSGSNYPLAGVTYPVDYGNIPGHTAEDSHELDLFVGNTLQGHNGYILVDRGQDIPNEHKFYVAITEQELQAILGELAPVLIDHQPVDDINQLLQLVAKYKD